MNSPDLTDTASNGVDSTCPAGMEVTIHPSRVARILVFTVLVLSVVGTVANVIIYHVAPHPEHKLARLMQRIDLGHEPSVPALCSSIALLCAAILLAVIAIHRKRTNGGYWIHWTVLSVGFGLMAIDETVMIHEMVDNVLHESFQTSGMFHFVWVIPALFLVAIVGLCYIRFLGHLDRRTRWLFLAAGALFVGGAVGMEMIAALIIPTRGVESLAHTASQAIEESCEMFGVVLFIYALLQYAGRTIGPVRLTVATTEEARENIAAAPAAGGESRSLAGDPI